MPHGRFPPTFGHSFGRKGLDDEDLGDPRPVAKPRLDRSPAVPRREDHLARNRSAAQTRAGAGAWPEQDAMPPWPPEADADAGAEPDRRPAAEEDDIAAPISRQRLVDELAGDDRPDAARARRRAPQAAARPSETVAADGNGAADEWDEQAAPDDDIDDVAVTIGRVVGIHGSVLWGTLYDDEDNTGASAARMGALVSLRGPESRVFGIVNGLRRERDGGGAQGERTVFEIQTLGEVPTAGPDAATAVFRRGVSRYPPLGAPVTTVTVKDLANVYARPRSSNVHIGQLRHNRKVPAFVVTDSLLGKHFAVLGTTGAGKSCAVTVILRSILAEHPQGHVVLLDPHNEYGSAFTDMAELLNPSNLQLPYWLLNFEEIAHILVGVDAGEQRYTKLAILKDAIIQAKRKMWPDEDYVTVDTPLPYRLSDLISALKEGMGSFNKADGAGPYLNLISRIESLRGDRRYAFMFDSLTVRDNMRQILAQLLRIPADGKPITIIDISGVPSEIVDVVVSVLFRLVFELAVWSDRGAAPPVLLVCEEAHRYVPEESVSG
ncbi:MAG: ATP-binding protein, partial [Geminicoccaceae bacterium]